jgi:hypothetical protein
MDTIRRRVDRGDLPAHKDASGRWMIDLDDSLIVAPPPPPVTEVISVEREELIRLRAENQALQVLLDEVRTSRDRTVDAEAELRQILGMMTLRRPGIAGPEGGDSEALDAGEPPRRWWQRRRPAIEQRHEDDPDTD